MDDPGWVNILKASKQLIEEELLVLLGDLFIDSDYVVEVWFEVISDKVKLIELLRVTGEDNIINLENL